MTRYRLECRTYRHGVDTYIVCAKDTLDEVLRAMLTLPEPDWDSLVITPVEVPAAEARSPLLAWGRMTPRGEDVP